MKVLRSILFTPGNNMRMIQKIPALTADAVVLDLEDSIPVADKDTARVFIRDSLKSAGSGSAEVYVRVNGLITGLTAEDCDFVVQEGLAGIVLPKVESKKDVLESEKMIAELESERGLAATPLIVTIETAKGVMSAYEIASASKKVIAMGFGAVDYTRDLGTTLSKEGTELFVPRSIVAMASRAAGVQSLDTVFIDLADEQGLIKDSQTARQLGFKGKFLVHPCQIDPVTKVFSPSLKEVEYARRIASAFREAEAKGLEGRMIDIPVYQQAKDLIALSEAIAEKEKKKK
jgi:citrate lyase subunit beta/citryl-CoA lyase